MAQASFFIVIEGMDGAGKTAIAGQLHAVLSQTLGDAVLLTNEPHAEFFMGAEIREALAGGLKLGPVELAQAFALNRTNHLARQIEPFLADEGRVVICDRYVLSSLVYQSVPPISMEDLRGLNRWARPPDLTLHLAVRPLEAYARLRQRHGKREIFENNLAERAEKYQAAIALLRDQGETIIEIDANPGVDAVFSAVLDALKARAPAWLRIQPPLLLDWD